MNIYIILCYSTYKNNKYVTKCNNKKTNSKNILYIISDHRHRIYFGGRSDSGCLQRIQQLCG